MFACWRGEVLASSTVEVLVSQAPTGAANVVRVLKHYEIEDAVRLLARELQLSGFHGLDFVLEKDTDAAYLLELNPRATQLGHLNLSAHGDLAGVMARKLRNEAPDRTLPKFRLRAVISRSSHMHSSQIPGARTCTRDITMFLGSSLPWCANCWAIPWRRSWLRWCLRTFSAGNRGARRYQPRLGEDNAASAIQQGFRLPSSHARAIDVSDLPADRLDSSHVTN